MASKRGNLAACSVGCGQILALGGVDGSGNSVATCELLETRMNRWRGAAPMSEARAFGAVVASACGSKVSGLGKQPVCELYCIMLIVQEGGLVPFMSAIIHPSITCRTGAG
jgi:hypothetical protein